MGIPDGAQTHGSGGSGLGTAVLVLVGAALAVKLAGPVAAAVGEFVHVLLIVAAVLLGVSAAGLVALLAWRWRRYRPEAARATYPPQVGAGAQPLPEPPRAIESGGDLHPHLHGISAEEVAAIIERHRRDG